MRKGRRNTPIIRRRRATIHGPDKVIERGGQGARVALYIRVSTKRQALHGFSLEGQEQALMKMVDDLNPSRVEIYIDAKTGKEFDDRKVTAIQQRKQQDGLSEIWVVNVDRLGRDALRLIFDFITFCHEGGLVRTPERTYNAHQLEDLLVFVIKAHSAEEANKSRAQAMKIGKAQSFRLHHWNRPIPFGYLKIGEKGWIRKDPEKVQIVRDIFHLYIEHTNLTSVAKIINEKCRNLGIELGPEKVRSILSDSVYIGRPENFGERVDSPELAIVDEQVFYKTIAILVRSGDKHKHKSIDRLKEHAIKYGDVFLELLLKRIGLVHRACDGGPIQMNGADNNNRQRIFQVRFVCGRCSDQFRFPTSGDIKKMQERILQETRSKAQATSGTTAPSILPDTKTQGLTITGRRGPDRLIPGMTATVIKKPETADDYEAALREMLGDVQRLRDKCKTYRKNSRLITSVAERHLLYIVEKHAYIHPKAGIVEPEPSCDMTSAAHDSCRYAFYKISEEIMTLVERLSPKGSKAR
ncbi:MAG: recombinase family protein, partial [Nitrososphaera sp.]